MCDKQKEEMERLFESFIKKLAITNTSFVRSLINEIEWKARLIGIKGARGVGKTTLLYSELKLLFWMRNRTVFAVTYQMSSPHGTAFQLRSAVRSKFHIAAVHCSSCKNEELYKHPYHPTYFGSDKGCAVQ